MGSTLTSMWRCFASCIEDKLEKAIGQNLLEQYEGLKGYEFKGNARIETSGNAFEDGVKMVKSVFPQFDAKGALVVKVDSIYDISPGPEAGNLVS